MEIFYKSGTINAIVITIEGLNYRQCILKSDDLERGTDVNHTF